jgi:hypothetical protein
MWPQPPETTWHAPWRCPVDHTLLENSPSTRTSQSASALTIFAVAFSFSRCPTPSCTMEMPLSSGKASSSLLPLKCAGSIQSDPCTGAPIRLHHPASLSMMPARSLPPSPSGLCWSPGEELRTSRPALPPPSCSCSSHPRSPGSCTSRTPHHTRSPGIIIRKRGDDAVPNQRRLTPKAHRGIPEHVADAALGVRGLEGDQAQAVCQVLLRQHRGVDIKRDNVDGQRGHLSGASSGPRTGCKGLRGACGPPYLSDHDPAQGIGHRHVRLRQSEPNEVVPQLENIELGYPGVGHGDWRVCEREEQEG